MNWSEALRRPCPKCGAKAAERCIGKRGERLSHHRDRYGEAGATWKRRNRGVRQRRCNEPGWVYFIGPVSAEIVKIGWTRDNPDKRLKALQTGNGETLHLYGAIRGTQRDEKELHAKFHDLRLRGEWFTFDKPIFDLIPEATE